MSDDTTFPDYITGSERIKPILNMTAEDVVAKLF